MPGERQQAWYVKASFGAEWGPMSADTLLIMADSGSLARDDMARCGVDGDWQPVPKVLILLRPQFGSVAKSDDLDEATSGGDSLTRPSSVSVRETLPRESEQPGPNRRRSGALPGWSNYWTPDASAIALPTAQPRLVSNDRIPAAETAINIATDESPNPRPLIPTATESAKAINSDRDTEPADKSACLDDWKRQRQETLDRLLRIVAEREAAAARAAEAAKAAEAKAKAGGAATTTDSAMSAINAEHTTNESQNPVESEAASATKAALQKFNLPEEPWEHTLSRWRRSLPDWRVAISLVLLPLVVWWLWPVSYGNIAATYQSMYEELREQRERPQDKTGMNEFVDRSHAKLDELIPWLERRASSVAAESQLLLSIGRDCLQPMLKNPRTRDSKEELTFKKLMGQLEELNHPNRVSPNTSSDDSSVR